MRRRGLAARFVGLAALLLGVVVVLLAVSIFDARRQGDAAEIDENRERISITLAQLRAAISEMEAGARGFTVTGDADVLSGWRIGTADAASYAADLVRLAEGDQEARAQEVRDAVLAFRDGSTKLVKTAEQSWYQGLQLSKEQAEQALAEVARTAIRGFEQELDALQGGEQRSAEDAAARSVKIALASMVVAAGLFALALVYLMRAVVLPVRDLRRLADQIGAGEDFEPLRRQGAGEIAELEEAFTQMADSLAVARTDLTRRLAELDEANRRLSDNEQQFRTLVDLSPVGIFLADSEGRTVLVNRRYTEITGQTLADLADDGWTDTLVPEERDELLAAWRRLPEAGVELNVQHRIVRPDGVVRWVNGRGVAIPGEDGRPIGFVGTVEDISALKDAELDASRLAAIVASTDEAVVSMAPDGTVLTWNAAAERLYLFTAEEIVGRSAGAMLPPELAVEGIGTIQRLRAGEEAVRLESLRRRKDGVTIEVELTYTAVRNAAGELIAVSSISHDIGSRKRAERELRHVSEQLARSNRELRDFASVASHDLKAPLRRIRQFGEEMQATAGPSLDEESRDMLARMVTSATRMEALVAGLLSVAQVSTRGDELVPVDLSATLREVLDDLELQIREAGAAVEVGDLPLVAGDPVQLRQLVQNLVQNALKFRHKDVPAHVVVGAERRNGEVLITVADNGIGFAEEHKERIFGVFERLHARSDYEGAGLGLALCRRIAERHGGSIEGRSTPGDGATFVVTLPAADQ